MIDLPCSSDEVFLCLANSNITNQEDRSIQEIVIASRPEDAQRQVELFWHASCSLVLSQTNVQQLIESLKNMPIDNEEFLDVDPPYIVEKLQDYSEKVVESQRHLVSGTDSNGENLTAIVMAKTLPGAYFAASLAKPELIPDSAFSISRLEEINNTLEDVRNGRIAVAQAYPADEGYEPLMDDESLNSTDASEN